MSSDRGRNQGSSTEGAQVDDWVAALRESESVNAEISSRLHQARSAALAAMDDVPWYRKVWVMPTGMGAGVAAAALLVALVLYAPSDTLPAMPEDEMLAAQEVELLEDLEFAAWLVMLEEIDELPQG